MDVKEAVVAAKDYVSDLFGEEKPMNLGLEEIEFDERTNEWHVTVGFSRPWESGSIASALGTTHRAYKILRIANGDGHVISVKNRESAP